MGNVRSTARERLRIIWAIAAKDLTDAIKNKMVIAIVVGLTVMMLSAQAFPLLLRLSATPRVVIFDEGKPPDGSSRVIAAMAGEGTYRVTEVVSLQAMEGTLADLNAEVLGLVIPTRFEEALRSGMPLELEGYVVWSRRTSANRLASEMETYLESLLHEPIHVGVDGNLVYPPPEGTGASRMIAELFTLVLVTTGGFLVPYLVFEEKQAHTMDALLVSPANAADITIGKALAGLVYCLTAMVVVLAFYYSSLVGLGVAFLAVLVGAFFAVGVGLLMGTVFETAQQVGAWMIVPIAVLLMPTMLAMLGNLPRPLAACLPWLPSIALGDIFILSLSGNITLARVLPDLALLLAWTLPLYAAEVWIVRRSDR